MFKSIFFKNLFNNKTERGKFGEEYLEDIVKDSINKKSNQKNIGIIKSSNLCAEIVEYSVKDETAVCNLASIALPKFINNKEKKYLNEYHKKVYMHLNPYLSKGEKTWLKSFTN